MNVKRCDDCKFSLAAARDWSLYCTHPEVNKEDPYYLSAKGELTWSVGSSCSTERAKRFFSKCGLKGKLWEEKKNLTK